jgi:hypothetical protein
MVQLVDYSTKHIRHFAKLSGVFLGRWEAMVSRGPEGVERRDGGLRFCDHARRPHVPNYLSTAPQKKGTES